MIHNPAPQAYNDLNDEMAEKDLLLQQLRAASQGPESEGAAKAEAQAAEQGVQKQEMEQRLAGT
jgi:hypothetical protein